MTELMLSLRRSPRMLLERDGHPGPGPGHIGLVMSRAGVGKTAFLVALGLDALLTGKRVLHVTIDRSVDKVRGWYDDLLREMLRVEGKLDMLLPAQLDIERRRHIHTYVGGSFSAARLQAALDLVAGAMQFDPDVVVLDRIEFAELEASELERVRNIAAGVGAELWMACRTHRDGPPPKPGHLPPPADRFEDLVDLAFRLDPYDAKIRLHVVKDQRQMLDKDLNVVLDPQTMLLVSGVAVGR